jgi:hypothetical protein
VHGIGAKSRLIPEEHFSAACFRLACNRRIGLAPPPLDRIGIALIGALQRLLRCQAELGQQGAHSGQAKPDTELPFDQLRHNGSRPQAEIQTVLAGVLAVDPTKHLPFLARRQAAGTPRGSTSA